MAKSLVNAQCVVSCRVVWGWGSEPPLHCRAILDTGNAANTLVVKELAIRLGLVDADGIPTEALGRSVAWMEVRGAVAGATDLIPTVTLAYRIKGKQMVVKAGVTESKMGCDVLICRREIASFEKDGYTLSAQ